MSVIEEVENTLLAKVENYTLEFLLFIAHIKILNFAYEAKGTA